MMRFYSDDPVRDAERHMAYMERNYVPVCCICDQPIDGEVFCEPIYGNEVCEKCYNTVYADEE